MCPRPFGHRIGTGKTLVARARTVSVGASSSSRGIVCFSNPHDVNDHLCIFADYATGRNNLAFMDKQTVQANLQNMFAQAQDLTAANDVDKVCFHRPGEVSVAWTHGHFFNSKIDPHPDWVTDENSFCAMNPFTHLRGLNTIVKHI